MNIFLDKKGTTLLVTILLVAVLLSLGLYFLDFSLTEKRISEGQTKGVKTYHLAEAGIQEMIWRLKHDQEYKSNFEEDPEWSADFEVSSPFGGNGHYSVKIDNTGLAQGDIRSVGKVIEEDGRTSRRIVKTRVYKAATTSPALDGYALFSDNDLDIFLTNISVPASSVHANNNIDVGGPNTEMYVENDLGAVNKISQSHFSNIEVGGEMRDSYDYSPPPEELEMPPVSFYDLDDPDSFKSRADVIYSEQEFRDLLNNSSGGELVLDNHITYVEGRVRVRQNIDLIINGLLVSEDNMDIGFSCGHNTSVNVNYSTSSPAGLIANGNIRLRQCLAESDIRGVVYATRDIRMNNFSGDVNFEGGMYARNIEIFSNWRDNAMKFNKNIISDTLQATEFSPVVTVEHWEEEY